jgi:hypothetical protein
MTPRDHNKTIGIAFGLIGLLMLAGLMVVVGQNMQKPAPAGHVPALPWELYLLPIPLIHLLISYGLFIRRWWARLLALLFSVLYVWIFPLGTLLAAYTWWVLYGETGRKLYNQSPPVQPNER